MTQIKPIMKLEFSGTLNLNEIELRALNEMVKYGHKEFLKGYYKVLGKSYLQPYEEGIISLFENVKTNLPNQIRIIDDARKEINKGLKNLTP